LVTRFLKEKKCSLNMDIYHHKKWRDCWAQQKLVRGIPPLRVLLVLSINRETVMTLFTKRIRMRRASIQILYKQNNKLWEERHTLKLRFGTCVSKIFLEQNGIDQL
jgi:hypothetical protein